MRIDDVLRGKGTVVAGVPRKASVRDAVAALAAHGIGALVVRAADDPDAPLEGILSERDIVRRLHDVGAGVLDLSVGDLMTSVVATCRPDDDVEQAMRVMTDRHIRHLPVVVERDGGSVLIGIVSIGDVVKNRIDELESTAQQLVGYINSGG